MPSEPLGRTNRIFPANWIKLDVPSTPDAIDPLVEAALAAKLPIDISSSPALWGGKMRGTEEQITCLSTLAYENATDSTHAIDLIQAHLIEVLSCLGREYMDVYFLNLRKVVQPYQLQGVLEGLEWARQEGHVKFLGIYISDPSLAVVGQWQLNDAFELVLATETTLKDIRRLAKSRRVGIIQMGGERQNPDEVVLVPVSEAAGVPG